jgi:hypothetical protein
MSARTLLLATVVGLIMLKIVAADDLTPEEQSLVDKGATMQTYNPTEHSRHFITQIDAKNNAKVPVLCFVFGMEDAKPAQEEGKSMAEFHYARAEANQFLFAQAWDKYHDRFFTRCYVQEGEKAYDNATSGTPPEKPANKMDSKFTPNPKLPPDAVELSASEQPEKSDYFATRPKLRPANVPDDYILVKVFHRGKVVGWSYLPKDAVTALHKPKKT